MRKTIVLMVSSILLLSGFLAIAEPVKYEDKKLMKTLILEDYDPLVDINITFELLAIRALDEIDECSDPDFFVKVYVNGESFTSPVWSNKAYLYDCWSFTTDVDDSVELVNITIQLWEQTSHYIGICDISKNKNNGTYGYDVNLFYDIRTGRWTGDDDYVGDSSGYGRVCGTGDGSIYKDENDCELWFNIVQSDYDNDGLPYWIETNVYGTDPMISNLGDDNDEDDIPIEWEHRYGYNPNVWDDHHSFDPDFDSINNYEEYMTWDFGSDPNRQDVFLELDFMEDGPNGENNSIAPAAYEILKNPFHSRNIIFHVDYGQVNGGDLIPYVEYSTSAEISEMYNNYFIKDESENWRRSVWHYGIIVHETKPAGYAFRGDMYPRMGYGSGTNSFVISSNLIDHFMKQFLYTKTPEYLYAANIMHEMGHNFGLRWGNPFGVDCRYGMKPWQPNYWIFGRYKSIMNYRYTYSIMDYSDGSHGLLDNDDWEMISLSYFEKT